MAYKGLTPDEKVQALELWEEGYTTTAIGRILGVTQQSIFGHFQNSLKPGFARSKARVALREVLPYVPANKQEIVRRALAELETIKENGY